MPKKKSQSPEILPPECQIPQLTQKKTSEEKNKKVKIPTRFSSDLISQLRTAKFRGLWIFASQDLYERWMACHSFKLIKEYHGTYNSAIRKWYFPWGATLDLQVLTKDENPEKLIGMRFSWVDILGKIDPEIQEKAMEIIASGFRNKS